MRDVLRLLIGDHLPDAVATRDPRTFEFKDRQRDTVHIQHDIGTLAGLAVAAQDSDFLRHIKIIFFCVLPVDIVDGDGIFPLRILHALATVAESGINIHVDCIELVHLILGLSHQGIDSLFYHIIGIAPLFEVFRQKVRLYGEVVGVLQVADILIAQVFREPFQNAPLKLLFRIYRVHGHPPYMGSRTRPVKRSSIAPACIACILSRSASRF